MNYASIVRADIANGEGFRVSLFVSGCLRKCKGCFNQQAQNPCFGQLFNEEAKRKIFAELEQEWCKGLSVLGGEPMSILSDNRAQVIALCKEVKERFPGKDIWMWSGYTEEELRSDPATKDIFKYIDVLVDGPFIEEKKDLSIPFRGSSNQRVIRINHEEEAAVETKNKLERAA